LQFIHQVPRFLVAEFVGTAWSAVGKGSAGLAQSNGSFSLILLCPMVSHQQVEMCTFKEHLLLCARRWQAVLRVATGPEFVSINSNCEVDKSMTLPGRTRLSL